MIYTAKVSVRAHNEYLAVGVPVGEALCPRMFHTLAEGLDWARGEILAAANAAGGQYEPPDVELELPETVQLVVALLEQTSIRDADQLSVARELLALPIGPTWRSDEDEPDVLATVVAAAQAVLAVVVAAHGGFMVRAHARSGCAVQADVVRDQWRML